MTSPVWLASPPEVHSALLSAGPGPGALLAAGAAWSLLSTEYASTAAELDAVLADVQAAAWQGPSAEQYVAAHQPYLSWLAQASVDGAAVAAAHETTAAAYVGALAAMPTLAELTANHATHATLVATNFFGANTIPIALNEADYARMWVQAAAAMATYQAVADAQLATAPKTAAPPPILKSDTHPADADEDENPLGLPHWLVDLLERLGIGNSQLAHDPTITNPLNTFIADILKNFGIHWSPGQGTLNGLEFDAYTDPSQGLFWVARSLELLEDFEQFGVLFTQNPVQAFQWLFSWALFDFPTHILQITTFLSQNPALFAAVVGAAIAPSGSSLAGLTGLAGLAAVPPLPPAPMPVASVPGPPGAVLAPQPTAVLAASGGASGAASAAPASGTVAGPPPAGAPPPAAASAGFFPPYLVPPGVGSGAALSSRAGSGARNKAAEPDRAAAAAAADAHRRSQRRARRRAQARGHGDEYVDMAVDVLPEWRSPPDVPAATASQRGARAHGFSGTTGESSVDTTGLVALATTQLDDAPHLPLLPSSWEADRPGEDPGPG